MDIVIQETTGIKRATGIIRHGAVHITLPKRWSSKDKRDATEHLKRVLSKKALKEQQLLDHLDHWTSTSEGQSQLITLDMEADLNHYIRTLNRQTFNLPFKKVRIGKAKFSRLAQMNIETRTMTVSQYCLKGVPEPALRYLIIHELAHLIEANHSRRFWALVAQHVPDYKAQSEIIKAFHKRAVDLEQEAQTPTLETLQNSLSELPKRTRSQNLLSRIIPSPLKGEGKGGGVLPIIAKNDGIKKQNSTFMQQQTNHSEQQKELPTHLKPWWQLRLF